MPLHQYLYVSRRSPMLKVGDIESIVDKAGTNNPPLGITGALLFDGTLFAQFLEGPDAETRDLVAKIRNDHRHVEFQELHSTLVDAPRIFDGWAMFYALADELINGLEPLRELRGNDAVEQMLRWVPQPRRRAVPPAAGSP